LDQVVLDLLIADLHDHPDDQRGREVDEGDHDANQDRAQRRTDQRDQIEEREQHRQRHREWDVEDGQGHVGDRAGKDADHEVAEYVAADRIGDVVGDGADARLAFPGHLAIEELEDLRPVH